MFIFLKDFDGSKPTFFDLENFCDLNKDILILNLIISFLRIHHTVNL